jgi:putative membrane protein
MTSRPHTGQPDASQPGASQSPRRWPRRVYDTGTEPDPRFTFANERTFLAWIRTALALIAAGISLDAFVTNFPAVPRVIIAVALILTGTACSAGAYRRWMANERALRHSQPLPPPVIAPALAYGAALVGLVVALVLLIGR